MNYNYNKKLVDLDDIVLCNDIRLRKELYEIYKKQNKEIKRTKIIKKIVKKYLTYNKKNVCFFKCNFWIYRSRYFRRD